MNEAKTLYKQFLKDKSIYNLNVSYWRVKLQKALDEKLSSKDQLFKNKDNNGKSLYDGNPIYSIYLPKYNKALRIIQEDPEELQNYSNIVLLGAWISDTEVKRKSFEELVISLFLTEDTVKQCLDLVKAWYKGNLNKSNIESFLNQ